MNNLFFRIFQVMALVALLKPSVGKPPSSSKSRKGSRSGSGDDRVDRDLDPTLCSEEWTWYEEVVTADEIMDYYYENTGQIVMVDKPMFEDPEMANEPVMTATFICNLLDDTRSLCSIVTENEVGTTTLTGVSDAGAEINTYAFTGGTDGYAGITGKVTTSYDLDADVVVVKVCRQD